jgi:hypothetical protein
VEIVDDGNFARTVYGIPGMFRELNQVLYQIWYGLQAGRSSGFVLAPQYFDKAIESSRVALGRLVDSSMDDFCMRFCCEAKKSGL